MHTPLCKHALGEPEEYAEVGKARGLKGIIMTCHSPMPHAFSHAVRMAPSQFDDYVSLVQRATKAFSDTDFEVKLGMESDWFPGMEDWLKDLHQRAEFHYILGSSKFFRRSSTTVTDTFKRSTASIKRKLFFNSGTFNSNGSVVHNRPLALKASEINSQDCEIAKRLSKQIFNTALCL